MLTYHWPTWLKISSMLLGSWIVVAAMSLQVRPGAEVVAVMFPPWWSSQQVLLAAAAANAAIVRLTSASGMIVVHPDEREGATKLRAKGAWFILDPRAVAACLRI